MLKTINFNRISMLSSIFLIIFALASCSSDDDPKELPAIPILSIDGDNEVVVKNGETIHVTLSLNAAGGNKSLVVNKGGGFLEEIPLNATASTYTYSNQSVDENAEEGEEIEFEFILVDTENQESSAVSFKVFSAKYDLITIGSEKVYDVNISGGVVESGTNIKFIEGRNYYISEDVTFLDGSSLNIESGVTVYLNAGQEPSVGIKAESGTLVDIQGTATNPVVMTSSKTLTGDAKAGDWDTFELEDMSNAVVRFLRSEYADTGLRLDNCDNTNTVEYIQSFMSSGEGIYITDNNINLKYLINTKSEDSGYRIGDDYNGKMQFIINVGADNDESEFYVRENASVIAANMTLLGPGEDAEEGGDLIEIKSEANTFKIYSSIVAESVDEDIKFSGDMPITDLNGVNVLAYSYFFNNDDPLKDNASDFFGTFNEDGSLATNPFFNNAIALEEDGDIDFEKIDGIGVDDFIPDATVTAKESFDPSTIDSFFTSVTFVGAVENEANDWTKGWVKNPDGSIR
ncbi:hypothetical protein EGM88_12815 [Aureibaculum marinum]|uniref:Uncharacterized protein n=1 Tax=Aureibaculum marinum TaxID=2487930 RepID=A0A3N4NF47_9FLAO|nr:hypothetical protein [Aureibaculum marinum]RPD93378.1 hypothetical protein EGM88_12815 [Aureibaculum marinum]